MSEAQPTESTDERSERLELAAQEERSYMLRFLLVGLVFTVASWIYTAQSLGRLETEAVGKLESFQSLEFPEQVRILEDAFSDLSTPSFYGGPHIPDSLVPENELYVKGLSEDDLVRRFISKDAFNLISSGELATIPPENVQAERTRRKLLLTKMRRKNLTAEELKSFEKQAPLFANYLSLALRGYPVHSLTEDELDKCQRYTPCLAGALSRRHPSETGSLKVLFQYANNRPFSKKSEKFMKQRLGYFIRARQVLRSHNIAPFSREHVAQRSGQSSSTGSDVEVLRFLQLHHWEALDRSRTMSIFLTLVCGALGLLFWRNRRLT